MARFDADNDGVDGAVYLRDLLAPRAGMATWITIYELTAGVTDTDLVKNPGKYEGKAISYQGGFVLRHCEDDPMCDTRVEGMIPEYRLRHPDLPDWNEWSAPRVLDQDCVRFSSI